MHYLYVLWSERSSRYYVGSTSDIERRITQHNTSIGGFTQYGRPWVLVHKEEFENKSEALKREKFLKRMKSARYIRSLVEKSMNKDA